MARGAHIHTLTQREREELMCASKGTRKWYLQCAHDIAIIYKVLHIHCQCDTTIACGMPAKDEMGMKSLHILRKREQ